MNREPEIIIEEEVNYKEREYFQSIHSIQKLKSYPWYIRIGFLLGTFVVAFLIMVTAFVVAFLFLLDVVTLFRTEEIHRKFKTVWTLWCKLFAFLVGFAVAVFSPQFGLSIFIVYLLLQGESLHNQFIMRMMNSSSRE